MKDPENMKYVKLGLTGAAALTGAIIFFFIIFRIQNISAAIGNILGILSPFVYGAVLAYLITPICRKLEGWLGKLAGGKHPKLVLGVSVGISFLCTMAMITAMLFLIIPQAWDSLTGVVNELPSMINAANDRLDTLLQDQPQLQEWWENISSQLSGNIEEWIKNEVVPTSTKILSDVASRLAGFVSVLKNLLIGLIVAVYLLAIRRQLSDQSRLVVRSIFSKKWADLIEEEADFVNKLFNGFIMGKIVDSLIIGMLCFIGCVILQLNPPLLISVIVGVTNIIPFFGPFIGAIPCALLLLLEDPLKCLIFVIFILFLQQFDGNFLGPMILGDSTGLPSFWVLFSLLLFGGLWGLVGMVIGVPLFAVIYDLIKRLVAYGLDKRGRKNDMAEYNAEYHPPAPPDEKKKKRIRPLRAGTQTKQGDSDKK